MKEIINGKLYDTKTATLIYPDTWTGRLLSGVRLYRTSNGNYFRVAEFGFEVLTSVEAHEFLSRHDPDAYMRIFGPVEDA